MLRLGRTISIQALSLASLSLALRVVRSPLAERVVMLRPPLLGAPRTRLSVDRSPLVLESRYAETSTLRSSSSRGEYY